MITLVQHVPCSVDYRRRVGTVEVASAADLDSVEWIRVWRDDQAFHRFSWSPVDSPHARVGYLMAELNGGKNWWVVAYCDAPIDGLPLWVPGRP